MLKKDFILNEANSASIIYALFLNDEFWGAKRAYAIQSTPTY